MQEAKEIAAKAEEERKRKKIEVRNLKLQAIPPQIQTLSQLATLFVTLFAGRR